jgi:hypothetical protein
MPTGTPYTIKCPRCKLGTYGRRGQYHGVRATGAVEKTWSRSGHKGTGNGGRSFYGHRGQVECLDCGHKWWSTHPNSGRIRCHGPADCPAHS